MKLESSGRICREGILKKGFSRLEFWHSPGTDHFYTGCPAKSTLLIEFVVRFLLRIQLKGVLFFRTPCIKKENEKETLTSRQKYNNNNIFWKLKYHLLLSLAQLSTNNFT